jgi:uncharacterized protein YegP (UPF0339 family)
MGFEELVSKKAKGQKNYFLLKAKNGKVILTSEMYRSQAGVKVGIEAVKFYGQELINYRKLKSHNGEHYFVLMAANNEVIGTSEMYYSKSNLNRAIRTIVRVLKILV